MKKYSSLIYIIIVMSLLVLLGISAPAEYIRQSSTEEISSDKNAVGNMPQPKKEYGGAFADVYSSLDSVRYKIDYIYLNYIPYSIDVINHYNKLNIRLNQPVNQILYCFNKPKNENKPPVDNKLSQTSISSTPEMTVTTTTDQLPEPVIPPEKTRLAEYLSVPTGVSIADYSIEFLKSTETYRYYLVTLNLDNGESVKLYEKVHIDAYEALESTVLSQLAEVNRIAGSNTDVNFVVYIPISFQLSDCFSEYFQSFGEYSLKHLLDEYLDGLDSNITYGSLELKDLANRANLGYLTDHHWSAEGVYKGYTDIISLFRQKSDAILPATQEPHSVIEITPCQFYGSFAREIAIDTLFDPFVIYDYELPVHNTLHSGEYPYVVSERIELLIQEDIKTLNTNAYGSFYPQIAFSQYPENNTGRNLLILGDSYTRPITELLASSFDNTYALYYFGLSYIDLDYNKFIEEHNITDVLYMQYSERALFDYCCDSNLSSIIASEKGE